MVKFKCSISFLIDLAEKQTFLYYNSRLSTVNSIKHLIKSDSKFCSKNFKKIFIILL